MGADQAIRPEINFNSVNNFNFNNHGSFSLFGDLMAREMFGQEQAPQPQGVSEEFINNLPKAKEDKQGECYICLDKLGAEDKQTCELPCGHAFDRACLTTWLKEKDSCPVCRAKLDQDRPHQQQQPQSNDQSTRHRSRQMPFGPLGLGSIFNVFNQPNF